MRKAKYFFVRIAMPVFVLCIVSCKAKKNSVPDTASGDPSKTIGVVSHQFKSSGCGTTIICIKGADTLLLIPMTPLDAKLDVDKQEISFNYRVLKVHNPKGCKGTPVQVSDAVAVKSGRKK